MGIFSSKSKELVDALLNDPTNRSRAKETFQSFDKDRNGKLDAEEFDDFCKILLKYEVLPNVSPYAKITFDTSIKEFQERAWAECDKNGDGKLSFEEFFAFIQKGDFNDLLFAEPTKMPTREEMPRSYLCEQSGRRWGQKWLVPYNEREQIFVARTYLEDKVLPNLPVHVDFSIMVLTVGVSNTHAVIIKATGCNEKAELQTIRSLVLGLFKLWNLENGMEESTDACFGNAAIRQYTEGHEALESARLVTNEIELVKFHLSPENYMFLRVRDDGKLAYFIGDQPQEGEPEHTHDGPSGQYIPNFKGRQYGDRDGQMYERMRTQYSTSSYIKETDRMTPLIVAYPTNVDDVVVAVNYAAEHNHFVIARSGGHQYCGMSSGGKNTIQLSMDTFDEIEHSVVGDQDYVKAGVFGSNHVLSPFLRAHGLTVPHGECPLVRIGGHVQTGGIGHQLRTLGIFADYIVRFEMVVWNPKKSKNGAEKWIFVHPTLRSSSKDPVHPDNDEVFKAVMGGGPSSWGVITWWQFKVVNDKHVKDTVYGYTLPFICFGKLYSPESALKSVFHVAMKHVQKWTQGLPERNNSADLFVSYISAQKLRPAVVLLETMAVGDENHQLIKSCADDCINAYPRPLRAFLAKAPIRGVTTYSEVGDDGVRSLTACPGGREFLLPYKKSMYCTTKPLTDDFVDRFVNLVIDTDADGLSVVFQGVLCGGVFKHPSDIYYQRRNITYMCVFDVFYPEGREDDAMRASMKMNQLLECYGGEDLRMFWGSFDLSGDELDMSKKEVIDMYYDTPEIYRKLQMIKTLVDRPVNPIFYNSFTVQMPNKSNL